MGLYSTYLKIKRFSELKITNLLLSLIEKLWDSYLKAEKGYVINLVSNGRSGKVLQYFTFDNNSDLKNYKPIVYSL